MPIRRDSRGHIRINHRIALVVLHDLAMAALAFELAVWLAYYNAGYVRPFGQVIEGTIVFTAVCGVVFWKAGLYRGIWYYASLNDLIAIVKAVTLALLIFLPILFVMTRLQLFPRVALVIAWPLLIALLATPRALYRMAKDRDLSAMLRREVDRRVPVLLVGASDAAETFIREMARRLSGYRVVGIVDDKPNRIGRDIRGVRVLGDLEAIPEVVARLDAQGARPQRLIVAQPKIGRERLARLLEIGDELGLSLARLPRLTDFRHDAAGTAEAAALELRPVDVEDLLGRPQKVLDRGAMRALLAARRVLVTGAGGTIGAELARQIAACGPARLALLDGAEHNLYGIDRELAERHPAVTRVAILGDVRDRGRLRQAMTEQQPELVFHAAALKHVPLAEANPLETILTNAVGTRNLADAARAHGVAKMVMISTDKAVNPAGVMGATKRLAELYCQALGTAGEGAPDATRFVTVRFGNVLGSSGSVVPLFERQLRQGGPLTVTHPDASRYFMTTREAVELVLQASALFDDGTGGGRIFVLDMGEPVLIAELARQMVRLAGLRPERDVAIAFTALRPGEKLHEELFYDDERPGPTACEGVRLAAPRPLDHRLLAERLDALEAATRAGRLNEALELLKRLVPEYRPAGEESPPAAPQTRVRPG